MKTTIFCFSGTGNSYYVAEKLAALLGDSKVVMMADTTDTDTIEMTEQVGFVFPNYGGFPPVPVKQFIEEIFARQNLLPIQYAFIVATKSKFKSYSIVAAELMLQKVGCLSSYSTCVDMPNGYVPLARLPESRKIETIYAKADRRIEKIADDISAEKLKVTVKPLFAKLAVSRMMPVAHLAERDFSRSSLQVTDSCTGCGLCYRMCPTANIEMVEGKPSFGDHCAGCLGCYHRCPSKAIRFTKKVHPGQYRNERSGYHLEYRT
jgi:ferredoxin